MKPSCTKGMNGVNGSIVASRTRCNGVGGLGMSMITSLSAARVPSAIAADDGDGVHLSYGRPRVLAEIACRHRGHRCGLDVGDGELGGGMPFKQLARQPA